MSKAKKSEILTAARSVFLRYGFKRVSMTDIAEAAGISRAALYLAFKNKEDVFIGVVLQWVDETIVTIEREMATFVTAQEKLTTAFELWVVQPLELTTKSAEARELVECGFDFAQGALRQGYKTFETIIIPVLSAFTERHPAKAHMNPERLAHVLVSASRGFKQTATTPDELRLLIQDLLGLALPSTLLETGATILKS